MEFLGKIYNTVSQNLPGNPITREYDIHKQTGSAGPGLFWKVFLATKKSTKQEASVWMFDKKSLERFSKRDRELLLETVKRGVSNLTRLRHPKILSVVASLEESRESLAFATEPAIGSLANLLGCHDNLTSEAASSLGGFELFDVEIKYGLLQLTEALAFLHQSGKQLHGNFCPESIVVNRCGSWKLAGMDFCQSNTGSEQCPMFACHTWVESLPPQAQPRLNYLAPEAALSHECTSAADIFSLGLLFYTIYNRGRPLIESVADLSGYKRSVAALKGLRVSALSCVPETARDDVKLALNCDPTVRPDASQFGRIVFFEDSGVSALQFMDNLFQLDNLAKSQFYKGLAQISANLPMRVNLLRIIPQISEEFANPNMIPFVLPTILQISESASEAEFKELILPKLLPVFKLREPVQISMICVQNIKILIEKCPTDDTKNHILPILFRSLDQDFVELQELCLETLPTVAHMLDYNTVKNSVVSKLKTLITGQCSLKIKVSAFMCLGKLLENMDKWFVLDEVLPMLQKVQSREPAILMSVLGIYKVAFSHPKLGITKDILASRVLPHLVPLTVEASLNLTQFSAYMSLVQEMLRQVESEQRARLQQLHDLQQEQKTLQTRAGGQSQALVPATGSGQPSIMDSFMSGLGPMQQQRATNGSSGGGGGGSGRLALPSNVPTTAATPATPLSLEDKRRLAREQEAVDTMRSHGPLRPQANQQQQQMRAIEAPKDLTRSLMERNANSLMSSSSQQQPQQQQRAIGWHGQQTVAPPSGPAAAPPSFQIGGATAGNPFSFPAPQQQQPQQQSLNMAPLDNLFGGGGGGGGGGGFVGGAARPSLNQLASSSSTAPPGFGGVRPQSAMMQQQQQPPPKPLSNQDLADLLG
ncbi:hypothetical protein BOX15_Mlig028104g1 [Macrostomum lignano]|uniref:Protein kinase domain-containing protein n=1 Tax=Macrostomum lignano TaxID=282301 RepID=A0A267H6N3_9PLAT|nr:hypothetical protein BOX15_Mlig028104g1 [Macrostomum lignano]